MKRPGVLSCSCLAFGLGLGAANLPRDPAVLELKDTNGVVRCRLGRLEEGDEKFGLDLFDAKGERKLVAYTTGEVTQLRIWGLAPGAEAALYARDAEAALSLGSRAKDAEAFYVGVNGDSGLLLAHGRNQKDNRVLLRSDPRDDKVALRLTSTRAGENHAAVELLVDEKGSYFEMVREGGPLLRLQNAPNGTGVAVDRRKDVPALRLGLFTDGMVEHRIFDQDGKPIAPR